MRKNGLLPFLFLFSVACSSRDHFLESPLEPEQTQDKIHQQEDNVDNEPIQETPPTSLLHGQIGMWVWRNIDEKIKPENREIFLEQTSFYAAPENTVLFLNIQQALLLRDINYQKNLEDFLALAHEQGFSIHALGSNTNWIDEPHKAINDFVIPLSNYNFDGLHFDVEAHLHDDWSEENNQELFLRFLQLAEQIVEHSHNRPIYWDLPPWYFKNEAKVLVEGIPVGIGMVERNIFPVLMSYRDSAAGIKNFSQAALNYFSANDVDWFFGVESSPNENAALTYADQCLEDLIDDISSLHNH